MAFATRSTKRSSDIGFVRPLLAIAEIFGCQERCFCNSLVQLSGPAACRSGRHTRRSIPVDLWIDVPAQLPQQHAPLSWSEAQHWQVYAVVCNSDWGMLKVHPRISIWLGSRIWSCLDAVTCVCRINTKINTFCSPQMRRISRVLPKPRPHILVGAGVVFVSSGMSNAKGT